MAGLGLRKESGEVPNEFKLTTTGYHMFPDEGEDVTLPCLLSPETSAVAMTIKWCKGVNCIYQYENGQVSNLYSMPGAPGRVSLNTQELERGNVSLRLRDYQHYDGGGYVCLVTHGGQTATACVRLGYGLSGGASVEVKPGGWYDEENMEELKRGSGGRFNEFQLPYTQNQVSAAEGEYVTLPCHLSPKISAVAMTIMWLKNRQCIYLYENGQVTEGRGWEGRVSLITQELERGNVSLRLRDHRWPDGGRYICWVTHGGQKEVAAVELMTRRRGGGSAGWLGEETLEELKLKRRESAGLLGIVPEAHRSTSTPEEHTPTTVIPECTETSYRLQCSHAGLFQCSLTGLVFVMEGEGEVLYRMVQWDEGLLPPTGRYPAGPLFSIDCPQRRIRQLHLPHCELLSGGGRGSLSVAHVTGDSVEVVPPLRVTDTHVVVNITDLSLWGLVRWLTYLFTTRGQVLPFLQSLGPQRSVLSLIILPSNVPLDEVKKKQRGGTYIQVCPNCTLSPGETCSLFCCDPEKRPRIQPKESMLYLDYGPNYHPTFQVFLNKDTEDVDLRLVERQGDGREMWVGHVPLTAEYSDTATDHLQGPIATLALHFVDSHRAALIERVGQVSPILDQLLVKGVINAEQYSEVMAERTNQDKMRALFNGPLKSGGTEAKAIFLAILEEKEPYMIRDLKDTPSTSG